MTVFVGDILNATAATVTGIPTPTQSWQWLRSGTALSGFTGTSYRVLTGDAGSTLAVRETETNFMGATSATSDPTATVGAWSPSTLFALSEPGVWYDADDYTAMFQDTAGTTPITGAGQTVGLLLDKSKQQTWIDVTGAVWTKTAGDGVVTVSGNQITITGATTATLVTRTAGSITAVPGNARMTVRADFTSATGVGFWLRGSPMALTSGVATTALVNLANSNLERFDVSTGTVTFTILNFSYWAGNHATQSTLASRPTTVIRPMDAERRNLLTRTEEFNDATWTKNSVTITANAAVAPDGTTTADKLVATTELAAFKEIRQDVTVASGQNYTQTWYCKEAEYRYVQIIATSSTAGSFAWNIDLRNGSETYFDAGTSTITARSITDVGNGWYRLRLSLVTVGAGGLRVPVNLISTSTSPRGTIFVGDGVSGILIWGAQLEQASSATPYQRVVTTNEWYDPAVPSYRGIQFDGVDDFLQTPTITPGTDKAQVFAGVRKLSDAASAILLESSAAIGGNNGAIALFAPGVSPSTDRFTFASKGTGSAFSVATSSAFAAPVTSVVTGLGDIASDISRVRANGVQQAENTADQGTGNFLAYPLYIGRRNGATLAFNGILTSLVVRFGANLSTSVINRAEYYVSDKTGVAL